MMDWSRVVCRLHRIERSFVRVHDSDRESGGNSSDFAAESTRRKR